jgi:rhodanese-related sulfurtransferase
MKSLLAIASALILILVRPTLACSAEGSSSSTETPSDGLMTIEQLIADCHAGLEFMSNSELQERIQANDNLILIDVRTKEEYDAGHLKGATWIERGILEFTLARTIRDPQTEIVVYCKKGNRSALAVKELRRIGYQNVNAHVGFDAWVEAGLAFYNYLGEAKIVHLREMNAASYPVEYHAEKK